MILPLLLSILSSFSSDCVVIIPDYKHHEYRDYFEPDTFEMLNTCTDTLEITEVKAVRRFPVIEEIMISYYIDSSYYRFDAYINENNPVKIYPEQKCRFVINEIGTCKHYDSSFALVIIKSLTGADTITYSGHVCLPCPGVVIQPVKKTRDAVNSRVLNVNLLGKTIQMDNLNKSVGQTIKKTEQSAGGHLILK